MNFTHTQLDNHAIAILDEQVNELPAGVDVDESDVLIDTISLIHWFNPQRTTALCKLVYINIRPHDTHPYSLGRDLTLELGYSSTPVTSYANKDRFCEDLAKAVRWIAEDTPSF